MASTLSHRFSIAPVAHPAIAIQRSNGVEHTGDGGVAGGLGVKLAIFYLEQTVVVLVEDAFAFCQLALGLLGVGGLEGAPSHLGGPGHGMPTVGKKAFAAVVPRGVHQSARTSQIAVARQESDILDIVTHRRGAAGVADTGRHPERIALLAVETGKRLNHIGIAVAGAIAPHNILHILWQLAEHSRILGHYVAPHQHLHPAAVVVGLAVGLLHDVVDAVDVLHIHLVGTYLLHILLGAAAAEALGLVAVDIEETAAMIGVHGILYLVAEEGVGLLAGGVDIGRAVHDALVVRYAQGLLEMGKTLEVGHHKGVVGILEGADAAVAGYVRVLLIVECMFRVIVAKVEFVTFGKRTCHSAELAVGDRATADVVQPSAELVCRPVRHFHAGDALGIEFFELVEGFEGIAPALVAYSSDNNLSRCDFKTIGLTLVLCSGDVLYKIADGSDTEVIQGAAAHLHTLGGGNDADVHVILLRQSREGKSHKGKEYDSLHIEIRISY